MKNILKKILNSNHKYLYMVIALIISIIILRLFLDLIIGLPALFIWGIILFIPIVFIIGFVTTLFEK